jgi:hypothetical protein
VKIERSHVYPAFNLFLRAGDEVLSDSFPISVVDDIVYEVKTKVSSKITILEHERRIDDFRLLF